MNGDTLKAKGPMEFTTLLELWRQEVELKSSLSIEEAKSAANFLEHYPRNMVDGFRPKADPGSGNEHQPAKKTIASSLEADTASRLQRIWRQNIEPKLKSEDVAHMVSEMSKLPRRANEMDAHLVQVAHVFLKEVQLWLQIPPLEEERGANPDPVSQPLIIPATGRIIQFGPSDVQSPGDKTGQPQTVEARYFFSLCPSSLEIIDTMKACSGCLAISYANKDAQKAHWKRHKEVCKILQAIVCQRPGHHPLSEKPELSGQIQAILVQALGRELTQFESDMLIYPRLCMVCLSGKQSDLFHCPICHCTAYCSKAHQDEDREEHAKSCHLLKICLEDHQLVMSIGGHLTDSSDDKLNPRRGFQPRATTLTSRAFRLPSGIGQVFGEDLHTFLSLTTSASVDWRVALPSEVRYLTFKFTCQLSTLYALEESGLPRGPIEDYTSLTLHIVGARSAEATEVMRWEIFAARLPLLERLTVVLIGPELSWSYPVSDFTHTSAYLRSVRPHLNIRYSFHKATYHEFVSSKAAKKAKLVWADAVSALNCGFIFYKSWDSSIPAMLRSPGVPLIFTEYYLQDCELNLEKVDDLVEPELEVCLAPQENPFCSSLPARIPTGFAFRKFKRRNVVMSNDFICCVKWEK